VILARGRTSMSHGARELTYSFRRRALRRCKFCHVSTCGWSFNRSRTIRKFNR